VLKEKTNKRYPKENVVNFDTSVERKKKKECS
jgi:hypothetical protein